MKSFQVILAAAATFLFLALQTKAVSIGFGEIDYEAPEGNGGRYAVVQKIGDNIGDLVLTVTTIRYDEIDPELIPEEITDLPDPAEFSDEENGRKDFYRVEETVIIPAESNFQEDARVFLPFYDDSINEEIEGYFAVVRINTSASDPRDVAALKYIRNGIANILINDDDEIRVSFENKSYTVMEGNVVHKELVNVVKEEGTSTERTLEVLVQLNPPSGLNDAVEGKDFELDSDLQVLTFKPNDENMFIPFSVLEDNIAEFAEKFILLLSVPTDGGWRLGTIQSTTVFIEDNDVAIVGFENEEYTIREEEEQVEVCVVLLSTNDIELLIDGTIQINEGTALAQSDFLPINNIFFALFNGQTRTCFVIPLVDDNEAEATETFTVTIASLMPNNVIAQQNTTTINIIDGDFNTEPLTCECDVNAECVDISPTERKCVCNQGYTGDGRICRDNNECTEEKDRCSSNAYCTNVPGSYQCQCKQGYTGNGVICTDTNECTERTHRCSSDGYCINLAGSYDCRCNSGFDGNGIICQDVNECFTNSDKCSENGYCMNNIGSYECYCKQGFTGNGIECKDINECHTNQNRCSDFAKCHNTMGSYKCHCKRGYEGDGYTCAPQRQEEEEEEEEEWTRRTHGTKTKTRKTHTRTRHTRTKTKTNRVKNHKKAHQNHWRMNQDEEEDKSSSRHTRTSRTHHTGTHTHSRKQTRSTSRHRANAPHARGQRRHFKKGRKDWKKVAYYHG